MLIIATEQPDSNVERRVFRLFMHSVNNICVWLLSAWYNNASVPAIRPCSASFSNKEVTPPKDSQIVSGLRALISIQPVTAFAWSPQCPSHQRDVQCRSKGRGKKSSLCGESEHWTEMLSQMFQKRKSFFCVLALLWNGLKNMKTLFPSS